MPEALVVFSGRADLWWLRLLRPGFRHCFLALNDGRRWIAYEPLSNRTEITVLDLATDFDLKAHYEERGLTVVAAAIRNAQARPAPWAPFTCVEALKRVLGIRERRVFSPWRLYRFLVAGDGRRTLLTP